MLSVSVTSSLIILMVVIGASSIMVSDSATKAPLMFSKWPPYSNSKSPALRHQIFQHLRSSGRIPQNMIVKRYPSYVMRPMKYAQLKKVPLPQLQPQPQPSYYRPTISTPPRFRFQSSLSAPNSGEYIFENPFNINIQQNKKKISLTDESKYNPIHTVAAPNLNKNLAYTTHTEYIHEPMDNQIVFDQKDQFNQITFRPLTIPQYQVTEQMNDHTVRVDPFTGKPKLYATDPVQSLASQAIAAQSVPSYKISQTFDSYNQPSAGASRPLPIEISFLQAQPQAQLQPQAQASTSPVAAPFIQLSNQVPQQQLPDTYGLPIGNQPQLQQHLLQQSMLQNVPVSVYNPTYLVTQSNNLLKQHREQLFKPAPAYLGTINQANVDLSPGNTQPLQDVNSAASPGQILTSAQNQQKQTQQPQLHPNGIPLRSEYSPSVAPNDNMPTFQRYIGDRPSNDIVVQQPVLTESELSNLLSIGTHENNEQSHFIASTFYQTQPQRPDPQVEFENRERQNFNDIKIAKANEEIKEVSIGGSRKKSAHQEHQEKLTEQFSNRTPLRIYVPDDDYQKKNELRRSDLYRTESKNNFVTTRLNEATEFIPSRRVDKTDFLAPRRDDFFRMDSQYLQDDELETTTDGNEDYLSHDTESVDRLALDGETRDPINSSTIEYNY